MKECKECEELKVENKLLKTKLDIAENGLRNVVGSGLLPSSKVAMKMRSTARETLAALDKVEEGGSYVSE